MGEGGIRGEREKARGMGDGYGDGREAQAGRGGQQPERQSEAASQSASRCSRRGQLEIAGAAGRGGLWLGRGCQARNNGAPQTAQPACARRQHAARSSSQQRSCPLGPPWPPGSNSNAQPPARSARGRRQRQRQRQQRVAAAESGGSRPGRGGSSGARSWQRAPAVATASRSVPTTRNSPHPAKTADRRTGPAQPDWLLIHRPSRSARHPRKRTFPTSTGTANHTPRDCARAAVAELRRLVAGSSGRVSLAARRAS